ncbi:DUF5667 domain-containing protein [Geodermatophilus sp. SYSU D00703]
MSTPDGPAPTRSRRAAVREPEDSVVGRLQALATALDDGPDPAFRAATRERLVAMAAVRTPEPASRTRPRRLLAARADDAVARPWRTRLTAGLAGAALTVTALGTLVAVATDSGPGDVLYGLKRGTEQTQLALAGDDRGLTLLQFAATRLAELEELPGAGPTDVVVDLLDTMDAQTAEGAALLTTRAVAARTAAPLDELADWAARQATGLAALEAGVPAGAATDVRESSDLLADVGARVEDLRAALACPGGPATDGTDPLGPVPVPCPAEVPAPAPSAPAPDAGQPAPGTRAGESPDRDAGTVPSATPAPSAPPAQEAPPGSTGNPGRSGGNAGRSSEPARSTPPRTPAPQRPSVPSLPIPLPPVGGEPETPTTSPSPTRPPLIDTPLPICIRPLVC